MPEREDLPTFCLLGRRWQRRSLRHKPLLVSSYQMPMLQGIDKAVHGLVQAQNLRTDEGISCVRGALCQPAMPLFLRPLSPRVSLSAPTPEHRMSDHARGTTPYANGPAPCASDQRLYARRHTSCMPSPPRCITDRAAEMIPQVCVTRARDRLAPCWGRTCSCS